VEYISGHRTCTLIISLFLKRKNAISRNLILEDGNGHKMNAMKVFSESIKYLKDHFVETTESRMTNLVETDIHWVLPVPAIWKDNAKRKRKKKQTTIYKNAIQISKG
jgi:hypothetical protein